MASLFSKRDLNVSFQSDLHSIKSSSLPVPTHSGEKKDSSEECLEQRIEWIKFRLELALLTGKDVT
jgi:hypothetical protein